MALTLLRKFDADQILGWSPVRFAEEAEHWEAVEMILIEGTSVNDLEVTKRKLQESECAARIFSELCRRRLVRLLSFALLQNPCLVQAELPLNRSPLHEAAWSGCPATVRCLVSAGATINATDDHGMTPLHEAAAHSNDYAVRILLDAGAVFSATDNGGRTALHYASRSGSGTSIQLLLAKGASVEAASADGCTALHEAATSPSAHAVRLLLDAGGDKHAKSASSWTALHWAASRGRLYAILILLEAGVPVDVKTVDGETPLHLAATLTSRDIWEALIGAGADEGAVDKNGQTPKERAADKSVPAVVGYDTGGMKNSDASPEQSCVPPGTASELLSRSNRNVCDSGEHCAENSSIPVSRITLNSTTQQTVIESHDSGTDAEFVSAVSGQTANLEGSSLCEVSYDNSTLSLSSVSVNSTAEQTTGFEEDEERRIECLSLVSDQRAESGGSSFCEEYSELDEATGSADETESGEQTGSTNETDSGEQTTSADETDSGEETDSDLSEEDEPEYASVSSANEEIVKFSEIGSVDEPFYPITTKNTVLYYEGPPLFPTLGTVGTSSKYNQQGRKVNPKFRGRGRGAPRGSRGNATVYTTRHVASVPRNENVVQSSQSQGRGRGGRNSERGSRKVNFNDSISRQARGQSDVNRGQPNTVANRGKSFPPHPRELPRNSEPYMSGSQEHRKTKDSSSLSQQQGGFKKKKRRPGSQYGEVHDGNRHEGNHGNRQGEGHHGNQYGEGYHSSRNAESHISNWHSEGHRVNQRGEANHSNRHGEPHRSNQYAKGGLGNGHSVNQQGERHAGKRKGEGRGGNSHGRNRGDKNL